jgi:hypothetical protein
VLAADVHYVFAKLYYVEAQVGGSWTRAGGANALSSPIWKLEYDRTGRSWGFNYQVNAIGRDFVTRSGFVNRNDIAFARGFNRLSWYGDRGAMLENFTTFFGVNRFWRYGDLGGDAIEGSEEITGRFQLRGGWLLSSHLERGVCGISIPLTMPGTRWIPAEPLRGSWSPTACRESTATSARPPRPSRLRR